MRISGGRQRGRSCSVWGHLGSLRAARLVTVPQTWPAKLTHFLNLVFHLGNSIGHTNNTHTHTHTHTHSLRGSYVLILISLQKRLVKLQSGQLKQQKTKSCTTHPCRCMEEMLCMNRDHNQMQSCGHCKKEHLNRHSTMRHCHGLRRNCRVLE